MSERPTFTLDEHDLSAHGIMMVRLYGYEPVSVTDIRGDDPDACDCTLSIKQLRLVGSPKVLLATLESARHVLEDVIEHPERWDQSFARKLRKNLESEDVEPVSPFWALPALDNERPPDDDEDD